MTRSGTSYAVQEQLNKQGIFTVKATPLGANLVLFEAEDEEYLMPSLFEVKGGVFHLRLVFGRLRNLINLFQK